jgi:hypothetical protein
MTSSYKSNWSVLSSIQKVGSKVDLIYGSHSLEHVNDLEKFQGYFRRLLKPEGLVFWEVPNALFQGNGGSDGLVVVPHTYYFTRAYFNNVYPRVIVNGCWDDKEVPGVFVNDDCKGSVIRFLGGF